MSITLTADGLQFDGGSEMKNRVFRDEDKTDATLTYTTSWANGWTTKNFSIPAQSKVLLRYSIPCRNDDYGTWGGGHYSKIYYSINDGAWVDLGHSGYTSCMHTNSGSITRQTAWHHFDFNTITSDFTIKFLFSHASHTGTGSINGNSIAAGANQVYHGSNTTPFRQHVTIEGFTTA